MTGQGQMILVTPIGATEPTIILVDRLKAIYETDDQLRVFIGYRGGREPLEVQETLIEIWNQQNTDGNNLNMVLCTNVEKNRRTIEFTHQMKQICTEGTGAKITFDDGRSNLITVETLPVLYAYQGNAGAKNLGMIFITRKSDGQNFIEFTHKVKSMDPYPSTGVVTGSIITFAPTRDRVIIDETPAVLYANQPK